MMDAVRVSAPTERRHPASVGIDRASTLEVLQLLNAEDATVARAVAAVLPELAALADGAVSRIRQGGSIHYFGAGTSGRLAVLDAAELRPTFNAPPGLFVAHHAGGLAALTTALENVEDDAALGRRDADAVGAGDVAIGLTASGRTPYVAGALAHARRCGALTALVTADPGSEIGRTVDHLLAAATGPEVITGSTRLKAGTAQKLILNGFSTAVMIGLGRTWSNLMVDVVATNAKLRGRVLHILCEATGVEEAEAKQALADADGALKPALLALLSGLPAGEAATLLELHHGSVSAALGALAAPTTPA
ncbi:MAG: N-acetylmuramic acid 6-phosphate etherase [Actinomycetota bacterium]|nr:N-acetylmuramic acid 6-phosphate etherase [Actinomycetota bacterium]